MNPQIDGLEVLDELGRGGFGVVHRAREAALDRIVAVKVLAVGQLDDVGLRGFEREARLLGRLSEHPHIVTVHATGRTTDDQPWVSMAWLPNGSLADRLRRDGPVGAEEAADIGVRIAGALETAHRHGILHRDVKPENVLLTSYGRPELADFGIARMIGGTQTNAAGVTASLSHAAPEVLDGSAPSRAADVYGLASTLFTLLHGRPAFDPGPDGNVSQLVVGILRNPLPDLRAAGVPDALAAVIELGLSRSVDDRPTTAEDFGRLLQDAQRELSWPVTELVVLDPAEEVAASTTDPGGAGTSDGDVTDDATRLHAVTPRPAAATPPPVATTPAIAAVADVPSPGAGQAVADHSGGAPDRGRRAMSIAVAVAVVVVALVALAAGRDRTPLRDRIAEGGGQRAGSATSDVTAPLGQPASADGPNSGEGRVLFRRQFPDGGAVGAATDGQALYVASPESIQAVDPENGLTVWSVARRTPGDGPLPVGVVDGRVILADGGGLRALDADSGEEAWTHGRPDTSLRPVTTPNGRVFGVGGNVVVALDPASGDVLWERAFQGSPTVLPDLDAADLALVVGDGEVHGIRADGTDAWSVEVGPASRYPSTADQGVLAIGAAGEQGVRLRVISVTDGTVLWSRQLDRIEPAAATMGSEDGVLVVADGVAVTAVDLRTGQPSWSVPMATGEDLELAVASGSVAVVGDAGAGSTLSVLGLYDGLEVCQAPSREAEWPFAASDGWLLADEDGVVKAHDFDDCQLRWSYELPDEANAVTAPIVAGDLGHAYVLDDAGWLTGFRLWDQ